MADFVKLEKSKASASIWNNPYALDSSFQTNFSLNSPTENFSSVSLQAGYTGSSDIPRTYKEEVAQSRFFYRYDPLASVVINRMVDMAQAPVKNKRGECSDEEIAYYNGVSRLLNPLIKEIMLEYLVTGMSIPDYGIDKIMGTKLNNLLGRKRYTIPSPLWVRNSDNIVLKRMPTGVKRAVLLYIPAEERNFILNKGKKPDGTADKELYDLIAKRFPEYIRLIEAGKTFVELENSNPILRKVMPSADYPQPYLVPSLAAFKHKWRIKQMDYSIATRAIESIRHVKVGNDLFPVVEGDPAIDEIKLQMTTGRPGFTQGNLNEGMYTLYTNHTVELGWVYPPLDALLSDAKYAEPNSDILLGLGFSRVLLVGESLRSNSGGDASTMGPISTLTEMRNSVLAWIEDLYADMADRNNFRNTAYPFFPAIPTSEMTKLVEHALTAVKLGRMSSDYMLQMFGTDFETEHQQQDAEEKAGTADPVPEAEPVPVGPTLELQQKQLNNQKELTKLNQQPQNDNTQPNTTVETIQK